MDPLNPLLKAQVTLVFRKESAAELIKQASVARDNDPVPVLILCSLPAEVASLDQAPVTVIQSLTEVHNWGLGRIQLRRLQ